MTEMREMTEIELLTAKIAEKQARLKQLKAQEKQNLSFTAISECLRENYDRVYIEPVTGALRTLCLQIARVSVRRPPDGSCSIIVATEKRLSVKAMPLQHVKICNDMLAECAPIVVKYIKRFLLLNSNLEV